MSRKTTAPMQALLANHESLTRYWATKTHSHDGELVSDVYREGMLTGLNIMLESALHNAKCYHGFRYVRFERTHNEHMAAALAVDGWITMNNFKDMAHSTPVSQELSSLEEQTRQYFSAV